ncbi:MAG: S8 family peptidase, partial [Candidatus Eremiobacterota bacterium]
MIQPVCCAPDRFTRSSIRPNAELSARLQATADEAASLDEKLPPHVEGEVLVKLRAGVFAEPFARRNASTLLADLGDGLLHLELPQGMSTGQAVAAMQADPEVNYAASNDLVQALGERVPNDYDSRLWGMRRIGAPGAWAVSTGSRENGPIVCVIDSGVDYDHPDLRNNLWVNPREIPGNGKDDDGNGVVDDVHGYNAYWDTGNPRDDFGHGTHCSGTIGAEGDNGQGVVGVNWQTRIMAAKFLSSTGGTTADAIKAIRYADRMGARITSNSWGEWGYNRALFEVLKASPALHICAAGNDSNNNDRRPLYPASYDLPNIVSVAAVEANDRLAPYSNWGAASVDLGAPGSDIYSTGLNGAYTTLSGTSQACPHV